MNDRQILKRMIFNYRLGIYFSRFFVACVAVYICYSFFIQYLNSKACDLKPGTEFSFKDHYEKFKEKGKVALDFIGPDGARIFLNSPSNFNFSYTPDSPNHGTFMYSVSSPAYSGCVIEFSNGRATKVENKF